jgi:outer membrane receptor protein involved in Fe transport
VMLPKIYKGKDRTFFFLNYEGARQRTGNTGFAFVPPADIRGGDFSAAGNPIVYDPASFDPVARTRTPFSGNKIPSTKFDPAAIKVLALLPLPNVTGRVGQNFQATIPGIDDNNNGNARIDHRISDKDNFFGRYSILDRDNPQHATLPFSGIVNAIRGQNVALNWVHIFSPNVINEVRAGFNRAKFYTTPDASPSANPAVDVFGFANTIKDPTAAFGIPNFGFANGFTGVGPGTQFPANSVVQTYQYVDNFTWIHGPHTWKAGIDFRRTRLSSVVGNNARGAANFTGQYTSSPSAASTTGSSIADLLLGDPQNIAWSFGDGFATDYTNLYSVFFQDDWKLTSKLTVNLGLRYEYASPYVEKLNRFTILDTSSAGKASGGRLLLANTSQAFVPGQGLVNVGQNSRSLIPPDRNNWAPRLGIAYRPFSKTVFRAGAGIFYDIQEGNEAQFLRNNPPYLFAQSLAGDPFVPTFTLSKLFPTPSGPSGTPGTIQPFSEDITNRVPYVSQWNATIEREVISNLIVQVGYAGSAGKDELRRSNFQQGANILVKDPSNPTPLASRVDYPLFSNNNIVSTDNGASSTYHGLLTKVERRFSSGLSMLFSYTFSKAISDASSSSNFDNTPSNPQCRCDLRSEKGPAAYDIKHRAVFSWAYELPFGKGKPFLDHAGAVNWIVGGWQMNGIASWQSGPPFTIAIPNDNANIGSSAQRADVVGDPSAGVSGGIEQRGVNAGTYYMNRAAFALPALFKLGNVGKNTLYAPGSQNWDASFFKNTYLRERLNLQLRGEFFNIFNHPNFGVPGRTINQPTFGVITSAAPARIIQFGAKLIF